LRCVFSNENGKPEDGTNTRFEQLGKVVNGPAPVVDSEETTQPFNAGSMTMPVNQGAMGSMMQMQQFLQAQASQMQPQLGAVPGLHLMPPTPGLGQFNFSNPMMNGMNGLGMGGLGMPNFGLPMPQIPSMSAMNGAMDPGMMMAHHQAMLMAKQAYQYAVAQQAMQAAGDEWERASHTGGFSPGPMNPFPSAPASLYASSLLGVSPGSVWGGSSAYARGPSSTLGYSFPMAGSEIGAPTAGPGGRSASGPGLQPQQQRQRTKTAPSSSQPPAHLRGAGAPPLLPPSSWKPSR
jgi:serine/arginine repetitive matrix protein 2